MRLRKRVKYDFVIYNCLIIASILIGVSCYSYLQKTSYSLKEILFPKDQIVIVEEPTEFKTINKKELLTIYINELLDQIKTDEILTYETLRSWNNYKILDIKYDKEILANYHAYLVNIEIENNNAILPTRINKKLSTKEKVVITLRMNVLKDKTIDETYVKSLDIPKNS